MTQVMTRVFLTSRMLNRTCQMMYKGMKHYCDEVRIEKSKLEVIMLTVLDADL